MRHASNTLWSHGDRGWVGAMNVLIISASMGAGHDGAARELKARLDSQGHDAVVKDFLKAFPFGIGTVVRLSYEWELRWAPWSYEATYRMWYRLPSLAGPLVALLTLLTRWRIRRWIRETGADAIVSTYPLASLTLGRARQKGSLAIPASTFITDFAVHPLWVHPGIDLHLAVHPNSAEAAHLGTGGLARAPGPLVSTRFRSQLPDRATARRRLGIPDDERVALLVAGSWGVGAVTRTFDDIVATGTWTPLVVCGHNAGLLKRLQKRGIGRVIGWTDEMAVLMAAADVLVENAGGLTCMEAFAASLPVVSYRSIAGHGRGNARDMELAGVAARAEPDHLRQVLDESLGELGRLRREAGLAMFSGDAATDIADLARAGLPARVPAVRTARRRVIRPAAIAAASLGSVVLGIGLTSVGAGIAAAHGVGVTHPPAHSTAAFVAVRLTEAAASDPRVASALARDGVTAIVSGQLAADEPDLIARLVAVGVDVANGGWGAHRGYAWSWANADVVRSSHAIRAATGGRVRTFVPGRRVDGFSLASAAWEDQRVVLTHTILQGTVLPQLRAGVVYCVNSTGLSADDVLSILNQIHDDEARGVAVAPLSALSK